MQLLIIEQIHSSVLIKAVFLILIRDTASGYSGLCVHCREHVEQVKMLWQSASSEKEKLVSFPVCSNAVYYGHQPSAFDSG